MSDDYLHGYSPAEQARLLQQNSVLSSMIYERIDLSGVRSLLEFGAGTGAQLSWVLANYPQLEVTGVERDPQQLKAARENLQQVGVDPSRWRLIQSDISRTDLASHTTFDGGLIVWVLEHLRDPHQPLAELRRILLPASQVFVTEVLNQSLFVAPVGSAFKHYWKRMNDVQRALGGHPNIGGQLGNLLSRTGWQQIDVRPYPMLFDRRDRARRATMLAYWLDLMQSSLPAMQAAGAVTDSDWQNLVDDWHVLSQADDAVFYYSFVQATARSPRT